MRIRSQLPRLAAAALPALLAAGCFDEPPVESGVVVFDDAFGAGFEPKAFGDSVVTSLSVDSMKAHSGAKSIRLAIPAAASGYSGGAVLAAAPQDLTRTNALVFWACASRDASFDELGFGLNFAPYASTYRVNLLDLPLGTDWTRHAIPIPDPSKLGEERGMFWWAEVDPVAYTVWLDDVKLDAVDPSALAVAPAIGTATRTILVGGTAQAGGRVDYRDLDGTPRSIAAPGYFAFRSSDSTVATVDATGRVAGVKLGHALVTAKVGATAAAGGIPVEVVSALPTAPATAPPRPTAPQPDVISLWSAAYSNSPVDTWRTSWSVAAQQPDATVGADVVKWYTGLDFVGIEFPGAHAVDATSMIAIHLDVWSPNATQVRVKLVDYGADAVGGGGDDSEHEVVLGADSAPDFAPGAWVSLELPLARFVGLASRAHLGLLVLSASPAGSATLYVDNVYFHR